MFLLLPMSCISMFPGILWIQFDDNDVLIYRLQGSSDGQLWTAQLN